MSTKTKSAKYAKMERGEYQSKICPYGYLKGAEGRMEIDNEAAAVVKLIFELAIGGETAAGITRELHRRAIQTPGEYKAARGNHTHDISRTQGIWSSSTVLRILGDERYTGTYIIGKRAVIDVGSTKSRLKDRDKWYIIPDHHPAIITSEQFDMAQNAISHFTLPHKKKHEYLLKGKVLCGCCGHALSRVMKKTPIYTCRFSQADETMRCHRMEIGITELEQLIFDVLKQHLDLMGADNPQPVKSSSPMSSSLDDCEQKISDLQDEKMHLYEQYLNGEINTDEYMTQKAALDDVLVKTKNTHADLSAQAKTAEANHEDQLQRKNIIQEVSAAEGLTPELADLLIDKVYVYPDKRVEIAYKVKDIFDTAV